MPREKLWLNDDFFFTHGHGELRIIIQREQNMGPLRANRETVRSITIGSTLCRCTITQTRADLFLFIQSVNFICFYFEFDEKSSLKIPSESESDVFRFFDSLLIVLK